MTFRHSLSAIAATVAFAFPAAAPAETAGGISIEQPWARETAPGQSTGGGFLTIANKGRSEDRLIAASSPSAARLEIHSMTITGGVMKMRPVSGGLPIAAGGTVELKPGGFHIMFVGLHRPFRRGDMIPATLTFAKAGKIDVTFKVEAITYGRADHAGQ